LIDFQPCEIVRERLAAGAIPAALLHSAAASSLSRHHAALARAAR